MDQIKIGKFLTLKRKEKKLTQNELSEKLGISNRAISKWENGICLPDASNNVINVIINIFLPIKACYLRCI